MQPYKKILVKLGKREESTTGGGIILSVVESDHDMLACEVVADGLDTFKVGKQLKMGKYAGVRFIEDDIKYALIDLEDVLMY
jgi:co-chaperonin GroES (HSP10)